MNSSMTPLRRYEIAFKVLSVLMLDNPGVLFYRDEPLFNKIIRWIHYPKSRPSDPITFGREIWKALCLTMNLVQLPPPGSLETWEPRSVESVLQAHSNAICSLDEASVFYDLLKKDMWARRWNLFLEMGC